MKNPDKKWLAENAHWQHFGIDPGIREAVAALNLLGFPTIMSCQGHLTHDYPAPWIRLDLAYEKQKDDSVIIQWKKYKKLIVLLDDYATDFYTALYDDALFIDHAGLLSTTGIVRQYIYPPKMKKIYLNFARSRFQEFAQYVGRHYLHVSYGTLRKTHVWQKEINACDTGYARAIKKQ